MAFLFRMWMLLLVAAGGRAAEKDLFETCATADVCVHPQLGLTCDAFSKKCLVTAGVSCANGLGGMCVSGASCKTNTCTCGGAYTLAVGKCTIGADKWAGACPGDGTCTAAGATCNTDKLCACASNKKVDLSAGTCATAIDKTKVGFTCAKDGDCSSANFLKCVDKKCACMEGYTGLAPGDSCAEVTTSNQVGKKCAKEADCGSPTMQCPASTRCACKTNYFGFAGTACTPRKNKIGGGCAGSGSDKGSCEDANAECKGTPKKCECKTGYSLKAGDDLTCAQDNVLGGACTVPANAAPKGSCLADNAICSNKVCICNQNFTANGTSCVEKNVLGGVCTTNTVNTKGSCLVDNAVCTAKVDGTCICQVNYSQKGKTCEKSGAMGLGASLLLILAAICTTFKLH